MEKEELRAARSVLRNSADDYATKKRRIIELLLIYSVILGVIQGLIREEDKVLDFVLSLPELILAISWCFTDAAERGQRIGRITTLLLVLFFPGGFLIYSFRSRGTGAFKVLAIATVLCVVMYTCTFSAMYVTWHAVGS